MPLILSHDGIATVLTMEACVEALEGYREETEGRAVTSSVMGMRLDHASFLDT